MGKTVPPSIPSSRHRIFSQDARHPVALPNQSVDLVVTSPPYPMIAMWDACFSALDPECGAALDAGDGKEAFSRMHAALDPVWDELVRLVKPGGFVCLNVGDAVRTVGGVFRLYPNHSRIEQAFLARDFDVLPRVIWRKTTNAPNKFMGSGMLPAGAYVTLEHEYILVFRKPGRRIFHQTDEKQRRRLSALFWEERNAWFSDLWDLPGERQELLGGTRKRSAAFPFDLAFRLVCMYSLIGDTVLDPFCGTGTTLFAAAALARNSAGIEADPALARLMCGTFPALLAELSGRNRTRLEKHRAFCDRHLEEGKKLIYQNVWYGFPVKTAQETELVIPFPVRIDGDAASGFMVSCAVLPPQRRLPGNDMPLFQEDPS